ncbi:MAG: SCO family protein [Motiliproteus sp.]
MFVFILWMSVFCNYSAAATDSLELGFEANFGGDFRLPSSEGAELSLRDLRGKVVLMTFGYTSCPDACPITMGLLDSLYKRLGADADKVQVLFASFDPERDDANRLKEYLAFFDSRYIGLTGSLSQVEQLADQYGVFFLKRTIDSAAGYTFAHSNHVYLLDQQGKLRKFYDLNEEFESLHNGIQYLIRQESR